MIVCPRCAYPYMGESLVVAERVVKCSRCDWVGNSSELLNVKEGGNVIDPLAFDRFHHFFYESLSPLIGRTLIQLGIVPLSDTTEGAKHLARILSSISKAALEAVVRGVLCDDEQD